MDVQEVRLQLPACQGPAQSTCSKCEATTAIIDGILQNCGVRKVIFGTEIVEGCRVQVGLGSGLGQG